MTYGALVEQPAPADEPGAAHASAAPDAMPSRSTWPLPALATWAFAWALDRGALNAGWPPALAFAIATAAGALIALRGPSPWRRRLMALGFPVSFVLSGAASALPAWGWLLPLALLAVAYPLHAWRDAPLYPTPEGALDALPQWAPLAPGARVLDAGCGLGHGLDALRRAYPLARLEGVESSWPLWWAARRRTPGATVRRADMWRDDWRGIDLVYLFQRPETMARAWAKAEAELAPGAWLASLEFAVADRTADAVMTAPDGRPVWLYRVPPGSSPAARRR